MGILLLQPPKHNRLFAPFANEPLALETIAASVDHEDVTIADLRLETKPVLQLLRKLSPSIVGITCDTADYPNVRTILRVAKQYDHNIVTVIGGHHASCLPEDFCCPEVNVIVLGMGELSFPHIVRAVANSDDFLKIPGIAVPDGQTLQISPPQSIPDTLDDSPIPRRDLCNKYYKHYKFLGTPIALISTSKGCPYRCRFCAIWKELNGRYIAKSPERIVEELRRVTQKLVRFADGNTFGDPKRILRLIELIRTSRIKKRYIVDVRSDTIVHNVDILREWKDVGLEYVAVGIESTSDRRLSTFHKKTTVDINERALGILHRLGIKIIGQFIVEQDFNIADFYDLYRFVDKWNIHLPNFSIATPYPGTDFFEECREEITTSNYSFFDMYHSVLPTKMDQEVFFQCFADLLGRSFSLRRLVRRWLLHFVREAACGRFELSRDLGPLDLLVIAMAVRKRLPHLRLAHKIS